jgi:SnoaL-like domain
VDDTTARLSATHSISDALSRYCVAVDRIDEATWWQVWHPDATAHYEGIFDGAARDLMQWIFDTHRACDATSHQVTNVLVDVDGPSARSESYVTACIQSGGNVVVARGRYLDSWSCRAGVWRLDERTYRGDIMQAGAATTMEGSGG